MLLLIGGLATTATISPLPDAIQLISLCTGEPVPEGADQILHGVAELASVHHAHHEGDYHDDTDFDGDRQLAAEVLDTLVMQAMPPSEQRLPSHTETLGAVVDRMAAW